MNVDARNHPPTLIECSQRLRGRCRNGSLNAAINWAGRGANPRTLSESTPRGFHRHRDDLFIQSPIAALRSTRQTVKVTDTVVWQPSAAAHRTWVVDFADPVARMRRRDCDGSVPPDLGLSMPGASGRTQPGHRCVGHLDARNEWFGRDRMLKRVAAQCGDRSLPRNEDDTYLQELLRAGASGYTYSPNCGVADRAVRGNLECKPYRSRLSRDLDEPRYSFGIFSSVPCRPLL